MPLASPPTAEEARLRVGRCSECPLVKGAKCNLVMHELLDWARSPLGAKASCVHPCDRTADPLHPRPEYPLPISRLHHDAVRLDLVLVQRTRGSTRAH